MKTQSKEITAGHHSQWFGDLNQDESKPAIFMLSEDGVILETNDEGARLLDYSPGQVDKPHISRVIPQLAEIDLLEDGERVNTYLRFLSRIGRHFNVTGMNGAHFSGELYFNDTNTFDQHRIIVTIYPVHKETKRLHA
ncbi:hypothetical protein SAMN05421690_101255 [Nitrosomonas sp. Nm51]|uniref:hypothetical protein n=1 Tax=Nitrosomonas sp. Nm51 TaxID=133720 RepID=UPI0008D78743|nr:hypothetical protein [Nitrosomonas sp. Nm51]SER20475.1 hypothetical protein SAMN05421690_101255 [Nitrosomonas sp. Nm51]